MIAVTGATGQLGRLVIAHLLDRVAADQVVALVRTPAKAADLAALGVQVREADYGKPATLAKALVGVTHLLLISSPSMGIRVAEHRAVIDAAVRARVEFLAYTSVLRADTSTLLVAPDHFATEEYLAASGIPWALLRNGAYFENRTAFLGPALESGSLIGCAGNGRISAASRSDFAEAAAVVLTTLDHAGKTYELGGDHPFTLAELAEEVGRLVGRRIVYEDLSEAVYQRMLENAGLPADLAHLVADSDARARQGALQTASRDLYFLIGRATTHLDTAVAQGLGQ